MGAAFYSFAGMNKLKSQEMTSWHRLWEYVETHKFLPIEVSPTTGPSTASVFNPLLVQVKTPLSTS